MFTKWAQNMRIKCILIQIKFYLFIFYFIAILTTLSKLPDKICFRDVDLVESIKPK